MKNTILALLCASVLPFHCAVGQIPPPSNTAPVEEIKLTKFDLNFPGGTPQELIDAIGKASGKTVNAIIPAESAQFQLPPLKMKSVTLKDLFYAQLRSSQKTFRYSSGSNYSTTYGFITTGNGEDSVWYFRYEGPPSGMPDVCRFYQLDSYLPIYKIEDITTAIKTGWEMLHITNTPPLKFHPETKLLIAVGPAEQLAIIDSTLEQLRSSAAMKSAMPDSGLSGLLAPAPSRPLPAPRRLLPEVR